MMSRFGMKTKLLGLGISLSLVSVAVGAISFYSNKKVEKEYDFLTEKTFPKIEYISEMFLNYRQVRISLRTLGLNDLPKADADAAVQSSLDSIQKYEEADATYVALGFVGNQKELYEATHAAWLDFKKTGAEVLALQKSGTPADKQRMLQIFLKDCPAKAAVYRASIEKLKAFHQDGMKANVISADKASDEATYFSLLFIAVVVVASLIASWTIANSIAKELKSIATDLVGNANEVSDTVSNLTSSASTLSAAADNQASAIQ